jgi:hypothetical protein
MAEPKQNPLGERAPNKFHRALDKLNKLERSVSGRPRDTGEDQPAQQSQGQATEQKSPQTARRQSR